MKNLQKLLFSSVFILAASGCGQKQPAVEQTATPPKASPAGVAGDWQRPAIYADYLNRDVRDDVFYFVMPDRFYNGEPANDNGSDSIALSSGGLDLTSPYGFHGGDMQGLEAKLDYLEDMGITAIWMTPILRNRAVQGDMAAHHGYWILDFTQIDPHFGSNDALKSLIDAAHARGMKIFFDIITNHTADVIRYEECHKSDGSFRGDSRECQFKSSEQVAAGDTYTPFIPQGHENAKVPAWLNDPKYYNNQGDSFWQGESSVNGDFAGLDDLNTRDPEVVEGFIKIYQDIISEFKPDGFRIDTVKHVDLSFWQAFGPAIMDHAKASGIPNFHIFGEVYGADPVLLSTFTTQGKLPAVLDFGFQDAAAKAFYQGNTTEAIKALYDNDNFYNDADSQADLLLTFLGNHDMGRTGMFLNQGLPDASDEEKLKRSILSHAMMYFSRGIPVVYYGDEQGFTGDGNDVGAREDMFPSKVASYNDNKLLGTDKTTAEDNFDTAHPIYQALSDLAKVRMNHAALRRGHTFNRHYDDSNMTFAFSRVDEQEQKEYLIAFNLSDTPQNINLPTTASAYSAIDGSADYKVEGDSVTVQLPPLGYSVLKAKDILPVTAELGLAFDGVEQVEDRMVFNYSVAAESQPLPQLAVTTELVIADGQHQLVATDKTPPYAAVIDQASLAASGASQIRVTVQNQAGDSQQQTFSF